METHYRKAVSFFSMLECHTELLRVLLEQVAFWEFILNGQYNLNELQCVHITRTVEIKKYMLETLKFELLAVDQFVAEVHCYLNSITGLGQTAFI